MRRAGWENGGYRRNFPSCVSPLSPKSNRPVSISAGVLRPGNTFPPWTFAFHGVFNIEGCSMSRLLAFCMALVVLVSCADDSPTDSNNSIPEGYGRIRVVAFDSPPDDNIEHIYLHVREVNLKTQGESWITLARPDTVIDFLDLVNGINVVMADTLVPTGTYKELRLVLGTGNSVVAGGVTYDLKVPSGMQSGVKIKMDFSLSNREVAELYVDFDASKSVKWNPGQDLYMMHPTFKAYKRTTAGAISGMVRTSLLTPVSNVRIEAISTTSDTVATLTSLNGAYLMFVPAGTYTVTAHSSLHSFVDTVYTGVHVAAGVSLQGYNFTVF